MKYESMLIIKGRINEEKAKKEFENIVKEYGKIVGIIKADFLGKRKLAYLIRKNTHGYFAIIEFEALTHNKSVEVETILKAHTENVLKFITLKIGD